MPAIDTIKLRSGTALEWTTVNPVLSANEPGYENDTGRLKLGDGTTMWDALPYLNAGVTVNEFTYELVTPATLWTIEHNLNCFPNVTVRRTDGATIIPRREWVDDNTIKLHFTGATAGTALLVG